MTKAVPDEELREMAGAICRHLEDEYREIYAAAESDMHVYGFTLLKSNADGTVERIDPSSVYAPFAPAHPGTPSEVAS